MRHERRRSDHRHLTPVVFRIPTAMRAWIEDVVVDSAARGRGVGEALTSAAVKLARERGAKTIDLTARRSRQVAHRHYEKAGFHVRDTSVYRFGPKPDA
jgi:ribosomal protein S18 acetylase RimI-like enzyme